MATAVVFLEVEEGHLTGVAELVEEELSAKILRVDEHGVVEMRLLDSNLSKRSKRNYRSTRGQKKMQNKDIQS